MTLIARPITADRFAPFGRIYDLTGAVSSDVKTVAGEGWTDSFTLQPLIEGNGHLGMTLGAAAPWSCRQMERHPLTEEALFCAAAPIVLAVAPASDGPAPEAARLAAFILRPGMVAVMNRGVWHDACRGLEGPASYYWMAICGLGSDPWVPVAGGPVEVRV